MNLYQPTISGSLTVSGSVEIIGPFTMSGGSISGTASFAQNAGLLSSLDSSSFVGTGSFNSMSSSVSTRVSNIEGNYATTGSNIFTGAQTVCANITSTGTIIAQTLNVQQVTSSVVYSSGSNTFGCDLSNVQQFTGSVKITGSLGVAGNISGTTICSSGNSYTATAAIVGGCIGVGGTFNPTNPLHIYGDSNTCFAAMKVQNASACCLASVGIEFQLLTDYVDYKKAEIRAVAASQFANEIDLTFWSGGSTAAKHAERMRIFSTGDIQYTGNPYIYSNSTAAGTTIQAGLRLDSTNKEIKFFTNDLGRALIDTNGIACFSCQVCMPKLIVENGAGQASIFRQTDASSYSSLRLYNDQNSATRALEIDYFGSTYSTGERAEIFSTGAYPLLFGTSNVCRVSISSTGITSFACQICSAGLHVGGCTILGGTGNSQENPTRLGGTSVYNGVACYGSYGKLLFNANTNLTGGAYRYLLTNALDGNKFGFIRSPDANTDPSLGLSGAISSGSATMVFDGGNVGIGSTSPISTLTVRCDVSSQCFTGIIVENFAGAGSECARAGIAFKGYDWVQGGIWHGRNGGNFGGALVFGTNPDTTKLGVGGLCTRLVINNEGIATFTCRVYATSGFYTGDNSYLTQQSLRLRSANTNKYLDLQATDSCAIVASNFGDTDIPLILGSWGGYQNNQLFLSTNCNVGIWTNSPSYRLDVSGPARVGTLLVSNATTTTWCAGRITNAVTNCWYPIYGWTGIYDGAFALVQLGYEDNNGDGANAHAFYMTSGAAYSTGFTTTQIGGATNLCLRRSGQYLEALITGVDCRANNAFLGYTIQSMNVAS